MAPVSVVSLIPGLNRDLKVKSALIVDFPDRVDQRQHLEAPHEMHAERPLLGLSECGLDAWHCF